MMSLTEYGDKPENTERYSGEIKDLLLAAQNQFFDDDAEVVREKDDFEKLDSFFELVQKESVSAPKEVNEDNDEHVEAASVDSLEAIYEGEEGASFQDMEALESIDPDVHSTSNSKLNLHEEGLENLETSDENVLPDEQSTFAGSGITEEPFIADPPVQSLNTKLDETDEQSITDDVLQYQLQEEYERGYADAVNALEKSIIEERSQIQNLNTVLFEIHGEFERQIKALLQEKIKCLALEFIGDAIDDDPEKLVVKIDQEVEKLSKYVNDLTVELNELDALAINANDTKISDGQVKFVSNANLARGEFKLSDGFTTYSKTYSSE
jgi:flagellar biosynthesis/type III secretory pathway protein FliH